MIVTTFLAHLYTYTTKLAGIIDSAPLPKTTADKPTLDKIYFWTIVVVGALGFLFLIVGGTRYALSKGEPANVEKAKNEIRYSLIGLVIAAFAAAIVNLVTGQL